MTYQSSPKPLAPNLRSPEHNIPELGDGERAPVLTVEDLETLDDQEISEGYRDGRSGEPEPGGNRSRGYWHGFENGKADREHRSRPSSIILARAIRLREMADVAQGDIALPVPKA